MEVSPWLAEGLRAYCSRGEVRLLYCLNTTSRSVGLSVYLSASEELNGCRLLEWRGTLMQVRRVGDGTRINGRTGGRKEVIRSGAVLSRYPSGSGMANLILLR